MVLLLREEDESFLKLLITVALRHLRRHNVNEVIFINGYHAFLVLVLISTLGVICQFRDESLNLLLGRFEAKSAQSIKVAVMKVKRTGYDFDHQA